MHYPPICFIQNLYHLLKYLGIVGNNNHYHIHEVQPRHYYQTAGRMGLPESTVVLALGQIGEDLPATIEKACAALPADFPAEICDFIAQRRIEAPQSYHRSR